MLETGIRGEAKEVVSESNSAQAMKSGELKVYATPSMIALMEQAAYKSVACRAGLKWTTRVRLIAVIKTLPRFPLKYQCQCRL